MKARLTGLVMMVALFPWHYVPADHFDLPASRHNNANPFVQVQGLPGFSGVTQPASGEFKTRVLLEINNEFFQETSENEQVRLDYERTTLSLNVDFGLNERLSLGLEIPLMFNSGGFLDGVIENWHDLFGLEQGGRDDAPRDQFLISYLSESQSVLIDDSDSGLGDVSFYADTALYQTAERKTKLRTTLKLPTGDEDHLFGSGGYAFSMSLSAAAKPAENIHMFAAAGATYLTEGDVLGDRQNNLVATATLGLGWIFRPHILLSAQLDLNTKVYDDSDLDAISGQAGVLYVSAQYRFSNQSLLQLGFTEDVINKDAAPDFGLRFGFSF